MQPFQLYLHDHFNHGASMSEFVLSALVPGVRFCMRNTEFEVSFVDSLSVRYSSRHGGRQHCIPLATFWKSVEEGLVGFVATSSDGSANSVKVPTSRLLSDVGRDEMLWRYGYVKAVLTQPHAPLSRDNLRKSIASNYAKDTERALKAGTRVREVPGCSTVARWVKRFVSSNGSPMALVPVRTEGVRRQGGFSVAVEKIISRALENYYSETRPSGKQIYCNIVGMILEEGVLSKGDDIPSERTIYRRIALLDPYLTNVKRHGKRFADARFRAAGASFETERAMQVVMIDGHHMDVIIVDEESRETLGRANLVCLFDVETRSVVEWYISLLPFCSMSALAAIKDMCSRDPERGPGGIPEAITPDMGRDLVSIAILSLCSKIPMHFTPAKAYSPDDKAHLERFFRTLNEQLIHMLPGTTFSSRKERGEYDSKGAARCTLGELRSLFRQWLDEVYHLTVHSATSRAPALAWRDRQIENPVIHFSAEEIDVFARVPHQRKINNGRVLLDHLYYKSHVLATWEAQGKKDVVVLSDELDLSFVYVYHASDPEKIIRAHCTKERYAESLTKFEHDQVRVGLQAQAEKDRREIGEHAYEVARWKLWNEIQGMNTQRSARQLARLSNEGKKKVSRPITEVDFCVNKSHNDLSKNEVGFQGVRPRSGTNGGTIKSNADLDTFELPRGA